jgi:hypothetical protein
MGCLRTTNGSLLRFAPASLWRDQKVQQTHGGASVRYGGQVGETYPLAGLIRVIYVSSLFISDAVTTRYIQK